MPTITKIGSSHGVIIDKETLARANLSPGDDVVMTSVTDGVVIAPRHSRRGAIIEAMKQNMDQYADTYRKLAQ